MSERIAMGRNKGLSIVLITQSMNSCKSDHFGFLANALGMGKRCKVVRVNKLI